MQHQVRNLMTQRLDANELASLARRAGGAVQLVGPTKRQQVEGMSDAQVIAFLLEDPSRIRRPIIDTGTSLLLGWSASTRQGLAEL